MQHSERFAMKDRKLAWVPAWAPRWLRDGWKLGSRKPNGYPIHPSVFERFAAERVVKADGTSEYRPDNLAEDARFQDYFSASASADPMNLLAADYAAADGSWSGPLARNSKALKSILEGKGATSATIVMLPPNPVEEHDQYRIVLALAWFDRLLERSGMSALPITCGDEADKASAREGRLVFDVEEADARRLARSIGQMKSQDRDPDFLTRR